MKTEMFYTTQAVEHIDFKHINASIENLLILILQENFFLDDSI